MGTPNAKYWPNLPNLPDFKNTFPRWNKVDLTKVVPGLSPSALDLLEKMLELNPDKRISAVGALEHEYFKETAMA